MFQQLSVLNSNFTFFFYKDTISLFHPTTMNLFLVLFNISHQSAPVLALVTFIRLLLCMYASYVLFQMGISIGSIFTEVAIERLFTSVNHFMLF